MWSGTSGSIARGCHQSYQSEYFMKQSPQYWLFNVVFLPCTNLGATFTRMITTQSMTKYLKLIYKQNGISWINLQDQVVWCWHPAAQ